MTRQLLDRLNCMCMMLAVYSFVVALLLPAAAAQDALALSCEGGDPACELILQRLNDDLTRESVSISKDSIMYTFEDSNSKKIDTGHSCSATAQVRSQSATARIGTDIDLDLAGDGLSDPFVLKLEVPVAVSASVRVKQRFGVRIFGSCSNTASDSYTFSGGAMTRAKIAVVVDFNPSFARTDSGDYEVSIDPVVAVGIDVDDVELDLDVSGVSPLNAVASFIHGFSSTLFRATTAAFTGDSVLDVFKETFAFDFGVPIGLTVLAGPAGDIVLDFIEGRGERVAKRGAAGFALQLETQLSTQVRKALGVSGAGKRTFLISKDYKQILSSGGVGLSDIIATSRVFCTWNFTYFKPAERTGGGRIHGPVALGERCTADRVGGEMRGVNTVYRCVSAEFPEGTTPPPSYGPCYN